MLKYKHVVDVVLGDYGMLVYHILYYIIKRIPWVLEKKENKNPTIERNLKNWGNPRIIN